MTPDDIDFEMKKGAYENFTAHLLLLTFARLNDFLKLTGDMNTLIREMMNSEKERMDKIKEIMTLAQEKLKKGA